ncbi:hypothetical protein EDF60_2181 [Leucobacter luti]|uniref:GAF domain-containing protein n=1 Tax=Leucobacter luti TaxID=340320 RepID=UPI0010445F2C|nr:GAF domain-containing protein [Leucobacter luti]MCW2287524.1 hypothetical protein [Leucobacter luti]TCK41746.1 hypothetical protein EDF60_2181 [Leucobacter luti]
MPSVWQALGRGESVRDRRRQLELAHERFLGYLGVAGPESAAAETELRERFGRSPALRPVVLESWLRSQRGTIDPNRVLERPALDVEELAELRRTHPISQVLPVVRKLLFDEARETGLIVAVGDAAGRLLWVDGDSGLRTRAAEMGFRAGMDWSERSIGTSAPGSALALDHAMQVLGAEHFNRAAHEWSCTAAPVHDPRTGAIIGVVDVTGGDNAASPHLLPLLQATLAAIEAELQLASLRALLDRPRPVGDAGESEGEGAGAAAVSDAESCVNRDPSAGPLALDELSLLHIHDQGPGSDSGLDQQREPHRDQIHVPVRASRRRDASGAHAQPDRFVPRLLVLGRDPALLEWADGVASLTGRHAEILLCLAASPHGWAAAALAEQVYGRRSSEQTLRAELVRLRRWLMSEHVPLKLGSRPYRLEGPLRVDATDTLDALGSGSNQLVLAAYSGPVLPGSTAPLVESLRADVDATLREAMLEYANPDALYDYAQHWAPNDAHVWETLLQVLPPQSPKRARVVARLEALSASIV